MTSWYSSRIESSIRPTSHPLNHESHEAHEGTVFVRFVKFVVWGGASSEELHHLLQRGRERVHLGLGVVAAEGGPAGGGDLEALHDGLGAVVAGADGDAV